MVPPEPNNKKESKSLEQLQFIGRKTVHDINNHLVALTGFPPLLRDAFPPDAGEVSIVDAMETAANQLKDLITDYHVFLSSDDIQSVGKSPLAPQVESVRTSAVMNHRIPNLSSRLSAAILPDLELPLQVMWNDWLVQRLVIAADTLSAPESPFRIVGKRNDGHPVCRLIFQTEEPITLSTEELVAPFAVTRVLGKSCSGLLLASIQELCDNAKASLSFACNGTSCELTIRFQGT